MVRIKDEESDDEDNDESNNESVTTEKGKMTGDTGMLRRGLEK